MAYQIHWLKQQLNLCFTDPCTTLDWEESYSEISSSPHFDDLKLILVDLSQVTHTSYDIKDLDRHIHLNYASSLSNPQIRMIFIVNNEETLAQACYFKEFSNDSKWVIEIVSSKAEAQQLLK